MTSDGGPRTSDAKKGTGEHRLKRAFWAITKAHDMTVGEAYRLASQAVGRALAPEFGLSTCSKPELIRIVDQLKRHIGQEPGKHRGGPSAKGQGPREDRTKVIRLASKWERDLAMSLAIEVFGDDFSSTGRYASFLYRRTGKRELRKLTREQTQKQIEALKAMADRGWKPRESHEDE